MKKAILSYVVLVSLVFPVVLLMSAPVTACGGRDPITLLELYRYSDSIYAATFRGTDEGKERRQENDSYSIVDQKKHYDVSQTLKGKPVKMITLDDERYIYHESESAEGAEPDTNENEHSAEPAVEQEVSADLEIDESESVAMKPGDEVLLFVKKNKESGKLEISESVDGIKKLSLEDRSLYIERIKELAPIFSAKKVDSEKLLDWLVRCAEDAATRWEGTYELQRSFVSLDYKQERLTKGEQIEEEDEYLGKARTEYAEAMTEYHRQALTNIVLGGSFNTSRGDDRTLSAGDSELLSLVSRWGSTQLAMSLLERVRGGGYHPYETSQMMRSISSVIEDDELDELTSKYESESYYKDSEIVESDEEPDGDDKEASPDKSEESFQSAIGDKTQEKKSPLTYKEVRAEITEKFVARAHDLLMNPDRVATAGR